MNLTSFLANKCFEFLLKCDPDTETIQSCASSLKISKRIPLNNSFLPPWSGDSKIFKSLCNGCGECLSYCENNILILNKDGFPIVDFSRGACNFCGACAQNCPQRALFHDPDIPPWDLRASITPNCLMNKKVLCRTCSEQCAREAIFFPQTIYKENGPKILEDKCDGCGACFGACPAQAITIKLHNNSQIPNR